MDQLRQVSAFTKLDRFLREIDDFYTWAKEVRLLHNPKKCGECGNYMSQKKAAGTERQGSWRCRRRNCDMRDREVGFCVGTFFGLSRLEPTEIFRLFFFLGR
jgi:hypothetical protein